MTGNPTVHHLDTTYTHMCTHEHTHICTCTYNDHSQNRGWTSRRQQDCWSHCNFGSGVCKTHDMKEVEYSLQWQHQNIRLGLLVAWFPTSTPDNTHTHTHMHAHIHTHTMKMRKQAYKHKHHHYHVTHKHKCPQRTHKQTQQAGTIRPTQTWCFLAILKAKRDQKASLEWAAGVLFVQMISMWNHAR